MDPTFNIMLGIAIISIVVFSITLLLDGFADVADAPVIQGLAVFAGGGAAGVMIVHGIGGVPLPIALASGGISGALIAAGFVSLVRKLRRSEHDGRKIEFSNLVGSTVPVIWWNETSGQVLVEFSGQRAKVDAISEDTLKGKQNVVVTAFDRVGDRLTQVTVVAPDEQ